MLYGYGLKLGIELLLKGKLKQGIKYTAIPVNYWRNLEYKLVYDAGDFRSSDRVLDIGSPKLMSLYLAEKVGAEVYSTDIEDYFVHSHEDIRRMRSISPDKLHTMVEDGRHLSYEDNFFTKVYALSVVEHIPDDGDSLCVKEIARVMSQGGRCVLTVPFWPTSKVEYRGEDFYWAGSSKSGGNGQVFYQRRYSEEDLYSRLIEPSGLKLNKLTYFGEKLNIGSEREISQYIPRISGPIQPLLSQALHVSNSASWEDLKKPLGALVVLEK